MSDERGQGIGSGQLGELRPVERCPRGHRGTQFLRLTVGCATVIWVLFDGGRPKENFEPVRTGTPILKDKIVASLI